MYEYAKGNILEFLDDVKSQGYRSILLYGAGDVATIMTNALSSSNYQDIVIAAIIDDDASKIGGSLGKSPITDYDSAINMPHEGILISSYKHQSTIFQKIIDRGYNPNNIIRFFGTDTPNGERG